jgi:hypothetical protein
MQRRKFSGEFKIEAVRARSREDEAILPAVRASFVASARTYGAHRIWCDGLEAGFSCGLAQDRTSDARSGAAGAAT